MIEDGTNGFVFPASDDESLEQILNRLYENRVVTIEMGRKARETAEKLTWKNYYNTYNEMLKGLLDLEG